jgi:hypothetical protein
MTYPQAQLVGEAGERILLQERAHKLVNKAELLAGAKIQEIGKKPGALWACALEEVMAEL